VTEIPLNEIPFNLPHATGNEVRCIQEAIEAHYLGGDGQFTDRCSRLLAERTGSARAFLTTSCTAALELAVALAGIRPGDEVIMPSFTFPTTAGAVARAGGTPVFVDIREDTLNLDERLVREALTPQTKALLPVHYAGVGCEMDELMNIASEHGLLIIEDAAQGLSSTYRDRHLGSIGQLGCLSFHETKNVTCGEGGSLLVNDPSLVERAEVLRDKGTNRAQFFRGEVDHYTWIDLGSAYLPSEVTAAFLWAQLEQAEAITKRRLELWRAYHERLAELESAQGLRRPSVPPECLHNGHIYYLVSQDRDQRDMLIDGLAERGIQAVFHYLPLHLSPAGRRYGRAHGQLPATERCADGLIRLPLWADMTEDDIERVVDALGAITNWPRRR
jgi:dTDP-4-amino-4,6-dideoxygalactose transaminase